MCGICGVVLPQGSSRPLTPALVERMRDTMTHRGPDGAGLFIEPGVALGHRRLSIVDIAHGAQPMASDDGALQIVYNGEVYNHPALKADLEAAGERYHTRCDTETVLRLVARHGAAAFDRLRGMFAIAVWNRRTRELLLGRDRLGVKPLYYVHAADGALYFASEIKGLIAAGAVSPQLNLRALPDYLANYAPSGEETLFEGVKRLMPGHLLRWRDGRVTIEQYWDVRFAPTESGASDAQLVDEFSERFREAVRLRLMADVPLGVFLSGGIDSAAIAATMSELVDEPIKTFSVAFAEREANELAYARLVADRFRTDHHEIVVTPDEFFGALPSMVWHEDEPIAHPSSIALNFVSRLASRHVKVVLTGEGSDESLAGYERYRRSMLLLSAGQHYHRLTPRLVRDGVRRAVDALPARSDLRRKLRRTFLYRDAGLDALYLDNFAVFSRAQQAALLAPAVQESLGEIDPYARYREMFEAAGGTSQLNRFLYADTKIYLHELLMKQDQMSMAASIESRVPFLDHTLVEWNAALPTRLKLRGWTTKYILRQAMQHVLPPEILSRRKMGFPVPVGRWLAGAYRAQLDEYVLSERALGRGLFDADAVRRMAAEHLAGRDNHGQRLWSLLNLEIWQRVFLDGEMPERAPMDFGQPQLAVAV